MKLSIRSIVVRDKHPTDATAMYSADKGHSIRFEDGLIFIQNKDISRITTTSNVLWMEPLEKGTKS